MMMLYLKIAKYTEQQRIQRLVEISALGESCSPMDYLELVIIQEIRKNLGEHEK